MQPEGTIDSGGADLVVLRPQGLYCTAGDFYIDPWRPVERAVITHSAARPTRARPAAPSKRCAATASSPNPPSACRPAAGGRAPSCSRRSTPGGSTTPPPAGVDAAIGPILVHPAVQALNEVYRAAGIVLPPTAVVTPATSREAVSRALIVAPPAVHGSAWARRFGDVSDAFASDWMQLRGARRPHRSARERCLFAAQSSRNTNSLHRRDAEDAEVRREVREAFFSMHFLCAFSAYSAPPR